MVAVEVVLDKMLIKVKLLFSSYQWVTDRDVPLGRDRRKERHREGGGVELP